MKTSLDINDRQFLERLHRLGSGTVQAICDDLGVTATAVRQRLMRLQALDLLSRETIRTGRGRPHHTYRLTDTGIRELGDNYAELAMILWRELLNLEDSVLRKQVIERIRNALVSRFGQSVQSNALSERTSQLQSALVERGFDVEVENKNGLTILRENSCPYHELACSDPGICELEQNVFEQLLGADVQLTQRCIDGHTCCEFQVSEKMTS